MMKQLVESIPNLQIAYAGLQVTGVIHVTNEFKEYGFEITKLKSVEISFPLLSKLQQQTVKQTQKLAINL